MSIPSVTSENGLADDNRGGAGRMEGRIAIGPTGAVRVMVATKAHAVGGGSAGGGAVGCWDRLTKLAKDARLRPEAWLTMTDISGRWRPARPTSRHFTKTLSSLWPRGTKATLGDYLDGSL